MAAAGREKAVRILVNYAGTADAELNYSNAHMRASPGDVVRWAFDGGRFVVRFKVRSPFNKLEFRADEQAIVRADVIPGSYPYAVAVEMDGRVFIDPDCPEIIVEL